MEDWTTWIMVTFIVWGTLAVLHFAWSWILYRQYSIYLQKVLLFIPLFFIVDNLIDYVYWKACPWVSQSGENIRYLQIVQIALVTVFNTFFVGLCVFICKGWALVRTQFTREELSSMSMIVAIFYLVYSAYFIASDIPNLRMIIVVVLSVMHTWVIFICSLSAIKNLSLIKQHIRNAGNDNTILESLRLKYKMLLSFFIIIVVYFLTKISYSCLYTFVVDNIFCRNLYMANIFL